MTQAISLWGKSSFTRGSVATLATALTLGSVPLSPVALSALPKVSEQTVSLLATQAAIMMNGTFTPYVTPQFMASVMYNYILPLAGPGYTGVAQYTPEALWPLSGLSTPSYSDSTRIGFQLAHGKYDEIVAQNTLDGQPNTPMLVFGYSQSAFIGSLLSEQLAKDRSGGANVPPTTMVLINNTNIPNGGLMARFGGLGLTPWTPMVYAPTNTGIQTFEVNRQYDPFSDFPRYQLNALSVVNSLMGYLLHFTLPVSGSAKWLQPVINLINKLMTPISLNPTSPNYVVPIVSQYGDTTFEFVTTPKLPILSPLRFFGLDKLADALDPVLRPLIEAGYDRQTSAGVPTPAEFSLGPHMDEALKQSWQAFLHMLNPANPAPPPSIGGAQAQVAPAALPAAAASAVESSAPAVQNTVAPPAVESAGGAGKADSAATPVVVQTQAPAVSADSAAPTAPATSNSSSAQPVSEAPAVEAPAVDEAPATAPRAAKSAGRQAAGASADDSSSAPAHSRSTASRHATR